MIQGESSYSYFSRIIQKYRNDIKVENSNFAGNKKKTIQNHSANEIMFTKYSPLVRFSPFNQNVPSLKNEK